MSKKLVLAAGFAVAVAAQAAVLPPGVQLQAAQVLVRSNGFEPESLDPAIV